LNLDNSLFILWGEEPALSFNIITLDVIHFYVASLISYFNVIASKSSNPVRGQFFAMLISCSPCSDRCSDCRSGNPITVLFI